MTHSPLSFIHTYSWLLELNMTGCIFTVKLYISITYVVYYFRPKITVILGFRVKSLTRFIENTCTICISK
jgi:hypothetical protein